jgi:glycosyltransferase involved in cell wall biosynthesis
VRLLLVNSAWAQSWGGGEKWTVEAAHWFAAHGHETLVVGRPDSRLLQVAEARGLTIAETIFGGDFSPPAIWRARALLKNFRADLAMVNFNKEAWQFGIAARLAGIPVVARHGFPLLRRGIHHRWLATGVLSKLVVNAASIREQYRRLGFPVDKVDVIHNGTALLPQKRGELRRRFGIADDALLVLGAGRLEPQKRFDRLLDIAAALAPRFPQLRVLIAGDGPRREELQQRIHTLTLENHVQLAGFVPDLAEIAGDADLFLLTSDDEGTPNVLLEAMAAGAACLSFDVGAVPEIFAGPLAESLIPAGDLAAMTARASELLSDDARRAQVAEMMRARIAAEFSVDYSMSRFESLFQRILQARP